MLILGIDPGTASIGWGLIKKRPGGNHASSKECQAVAYGCIKTNPKQKMPARLADLHQQLIRLLRQYRPEAAAVEELFFFKNQKTAISVSQARGVILLTVQQNKLPIYEYTPLQIKQAMSGYGRAEKKQVQHMVKIILGLPEIPRPDDAADALAAAICCAHSIKLEQFSV